MIFTGYNPYGPHAAPPAPEVSPAVKKAARLAGASHLSADGLWIYCERYGAVFEAERDGSNFGAWWPAEGGLPAGTVLLDKEL